MNIGFNGSYVFKINLQGMFLNETIQIKKNNIITLLGESFFLNRAINDTFSPIQYICLGNSKNRPQKKDLQLGNEVLRRKCSKQVDLDNKQIILSATFQAKEISGTTEIGVSNGDILISHDVYNKNDIEDILTPTIGDISIDYYIELSSGAIHNRNWVPATNMTNVYYITEPNTVVGIFENNTNSGYMNNKKLDGLDSVKGAYYYDINTKNLYVHTTKDTNPTEEELIILTR